MPKYYKQLVLFFFFAFFCVLLQKQQVYALQNSLPSVKNIHLSSPIPIPVTDKKRQTDIQKLFSQRPITQVNPFNLIAYAVRSTISAGVPVDSLLLILSIPIIATVVIFLRYIIGFPTLGIAPTIVFAITFFITGIVFGSILFATLLLATLLSRILFKKVRIMQLAKVSLSMLVISILILISLVTSLHYSLIQSSQVSIFPILLFILLSERVVALQLEKNILEALGITMLTLIIGATGFFVISTAFMRNLLLVYPEVLLLLLPINWFIGRYFGLRLTEYFRFVPNIKYGTK